VNERRTEAAGVSRRSDFSATLRLEPKPSPLALIGLFAAYTFAAYVGLAWAQVDGAASPVWPASGVAVAGLVFGGVRLWPAIFAGRLFAAFLAGSTQPVWAELLIASGVTFSGVVAVLMLRRWRISTDLSNLVSMLRFIAFGGLVKGFISALSGALTLSASSGLDAAAAWKVFGMWYAGDVAGLLVVGPLLLSWQRGQKVENPFYLALIGLATALMCWLVFLVPQITVFRIWHVLPLLLWAALAYQVRGASLAIFVMAVLATAGTAVGVVTFTATELSPLEHIPRLQQFLAITSVTVLVTASIDAERRQKGEDRLKVALDAAGQGSFEIDLRSGAVTGDDVATRLLRLPVAQPATFEALTDRVHPDDRATVREAIRISGLRPGSGMFRIEHRILTEDGSPCWLALHGRTSFDGDGQESMPTIARGVVRDITVRKMAEQKVLDSERFTRRVLDNLFAFVGVLSPDGVLLQANRAPLEAAQIKAEDVVGRHFWDCYWWSYSPKVQRQLRQAIHKALNGELVRYDVQIRVAGGQLIWIDFQLAPLRDANGQITHLIPSGIDMSARMDAEEASRRLISILEATPDFIGMTDVSGRLSWLNPGARRIIGVSPSADVSRFTISELHSARAYAQIVAAGYPAAAEKGVWEGESDVVGADGRAIPVSQVIVAHRDELGRVTQYSTILRDISEQKKAQEHQLLLLRELSHRVKNTLAVIQSIARQTLRSNPDPARFAEVFQGRIASLAASHALLTDNDWKGAALSQVVEQQLWPLMGEDRRRLVLAGPPVVLPAEPATQLGLVLHEVGTNAVKHGALSTSAGKIRVEWRDVSGNLRFSWRERGGPPAHPARNGGGFGSRLIDMSVKDVARRFEPSGLEVEFTLDLPRPAPPARR